MKNIWGVAKRHENAIAKVKKEDTLLMYTRQEIVNREIIPSAITGIYKAASDVYLDEFPVFVTPKNLGDEVFPFRIKLKPIKIFKEPIQFKPLVPKLKFIKNKTMWSGSIRTAMRVIPEGDYQIIIQQR